MAKCECLSGCPFFNDLMEKMPNMSKSIKDKYCLTDNSGCARYIVFKKLGKSSVPPTLFPHQRDRIDKLLKKD